MASGRAARRHFRDGGDGVVAVRKFDLLERSALDAGLLGESSDGEAGEGQNEQSLFEHGFSSLERPTLAARQFPARWQSARSALDALERGHDAALE